MLLRIKYVTLLLAFAASSSLFAQQHDNVWLLGNVGILSTEMDFGLGVTITPNINRSLEILRMHASICDSAGNLQFYTNGLNIYNAQYQLMQNGDDLNPGQLANDLYTHYIPAEGAISIPHPNEANKYYLFHQWSSWASITAEFAEHLCYSLIDMNANNGLGIVEQKNQILVSDSIAGGQLELVQHGNGKDWWLVQAIGGSNGLYVFLVANDTIVLSSKQYIGNSNRILGSEPVGQAVFSPNGTKYARYDYKNDVDIFDFDRCTGLFSNPIHIPIQDTLDGLTALEACGVAISPNNRYLYVPSLLYIYQFDLEASNIATSKNTVALYDGFRDTVTPSVILPISFGLIQLAPDGKIYGNAGNNRYLHVIHSPDSAGIACNVEQHGVYIYQNNGYYIPNFPHYRTPALAGSPCDTLTSTIAIETQQNNWQLTLYPNPTNKKLTIESNWQLDQQTSVAVYNSIGQMMQVKWIENEGNKISIATDELTDGMYIVELKQKDRKVSRTFVVSKK